MIDVLIVWTFQVTLLLYLSPLCHSVLSNCDGFWVCVGLDLIFRTFFEP